MGPQRGRISLWQQLTDLTSFDIFKDNTYLNAETPHLFFLLDEQSADEGSSADAPAWKKYHGALQGKGGHGIHCILAAQNAEQKPRLLGRGTDSDHADPTPNNQRQRPALGCRTQ